MKKLLLLMAGFLLTGFALNAQEEFTPGLSVSGEFVVRSQVEVDGAGAVGLDESKLSFHYRFTEYTGVVYTLFIGQNGNDGMWSRTWGEANPFNNYANNRNGGVGTDEVYAYTDILGELGLNSIMGMRMKIGMFDDNSEFRVAAHALDFGFETGDGIQSDGMEDLWNIRWDFPMNFLEDVFPLNIYIVHDADFSRSNNDVSVGLHIESVGLEIMQIVAIDWNLYYNYRGMVNVGDGTRIIDDTDPDNIITEGFMQGREAHTFGGTLGFSMRMFDNQRMGFGFAFDYQRFTGRGANRVGNDLINNYDERMASRFGYGVGMRYTWDDMFRFNVGYNARMTLHEGGNDITQNWMAFRIDLMMVPLITIFAGMSVDFRSTDAIAANTERDFRGYHRLGVDAGVMFNGISNVELTVGWFWGNTANGTIEGPNFNGGGRMGNFGYMKAKFFF